MGDYKKYPGEHIGKNYCNTYAKNMTKFMDFKYPDSLHHDEKFHDEIVDAYCEHALEVIQNITKDSKQDLKILLLENKVLDKTEIYNLSAKYKYAIENNEIPVILAKNIDYKCGGAMYQEYKKEIYRKAKENNKNQQTKKNKKNRQNKNKFRIKDIGQIDGMIIMPLEQMEGRKKYRINQKKSYCMLMEIKSSYRMNSKHHRQIRDASEFCIDPSLKDPYNILYVDGLLVTPYITERTYTHRVQP